MKANLHTHTTRCRHAVGTDRDYVEAALAAGLSTLGFSDHCPWPRTPPLPPAGFRSGVRMDPEEVGGYFDSLLALREEFAGRIRILIGFEVEHLPWRIAAQDELFARFPVDYLILGQHFLEDEWESVYFGFPFSEERRLADYVDRCIEGMSSGRYLYLAHPDVAHFTGPEDVYARHMGRLCAFLHERGAPIEVNLLGLSGPRNYPSERFLRLAAEVGCSAFLAVDAHNPDAIRNAALVQAGAALCARSGIPLVEAPLPPSARQDADVRSR